MKKSQRDHISSIDEFEDLTLFANESFDTQDVDLFEFTSEESSPLTRLKSIILSLDWEINDEILQELDDELENLQSVWTDDKVAEVYLQGLKKIGNYIRTKGAYAHPNSIKLLLTFFYNFEKIISSEKITGEEITRLLKSDVRKFKILQYQINQSETETAPQSSAQVATNEPVEQVATPLTESDVTKQLKAAILSLDWEVTDDSLRQFNDRLAGFHQLMADNKPALVLAQGLQALGDYIADERADAHPEAFILLHSFNDALEQVLRTGGQQLEQNKIQDILVDQINRLNNLKLLIASPSGMLVDDQRIDEMVEELSAPASTETIAEQPIPRKESVTPSPSEPAEEPTVGLAVDTEEAMEATGNLEAEIDTFFTIDSVPAMESADVQYPDEVLPPDAIHPVDDELADDFIEAHLSTKRGFMPALSDAEESSGFDENAEQLDVRAQSDLADQLDFLFADAEGDDDSSVTFSALDSTDLELAIDNEEDLAGEEEEPAFALADDIEDLEEGPVAALTAMDEEIEKGTVAALADEDEDAEGDGVVAALSDAFAPEAQMDFDGDVIANDAGEADLDIESKLDSFFVGADEETAESVDAPQDTVEEIEQSLFFNEEDQVQAALADIEEEHGFSEEAEVATLNFTPMDEIEEKLDFFFGSEGDEEAEPEEYRIELSSSDMLDTSLNLTFDAPEATPSVEPALAGFASEETVSEELEEALEEEEQLEASLAEELAFFSTETEEALQESASSTVDELTSALEATIGEGQQAPASEALQMQLAALGALLPGIVRAPTHEKLAEATALVAPLKQTGLSAEQLALVQLLDAVITMLVRLPTKDAAETEKLVNYLYGLLLADHCPPSALPEAVVRYTAWLQHASTIMPVVPVAASQDQDSQYAYTAKELYFELSELRAHIREEFAKLRHEMHHLKT